jgi:hypothetical protein
MDGAQLPRPVLFFGLRMANEEEGGQVERHARIDAFLAVIKQCAKYGNGSQAKQPKPWEAALISSPPLPASRLYPKRKAAAGNE